MEITQILSELEHHRGYFPDAAVRAAMERRVELTPRFLEILRDTIANAPLMAEQEGRYGHLYAMYLLAAWRETAAYPLIIQYSRLPGELPHDLGGDLVTEDLGRILASVFDGDLGPIQAIVEDPGLDEYVRDAALRSLVVLVAADRIPRDDVIDYFKILMNGRLEREPSPIWGSMVAYAGRLQPTDLMEDIRLAYQEGIVNPGYVSLEGVERDALQKVEDVLTNLREHQTLMGEPIREMSWWACFREMPAPAAPKIEAAKKTVGVKIARTGPCPCGSRRKYKKCCGKAK